MTPVSRLDHNPATGAFNVSFPEYVAKMKELATEEDVALVDLSALSRAYLDSIGPEAARSVFLHTPAGVYTAWPNGSADNTHFQEYGAIQMARLVAGAVKGLGLPLSALVKEVEPPAAVPAKPTGLVAGGISNSGAVLKWDAAVTADVYQVFRKGSDGAWTLATTATIPQAALSGLAEGRSYDFRVVAVNGRGDSEPSDPVTVTTRQAKYRYDFGPATSPVAAGSHAGHPRHPLHGRARPRSHRRHRNDRQGQGRGPGRRGQGLPRLLQRPLRSSRWTCPTGCTG
ncbi:hypothetical protein GCM10020219_020540 [Nonomuraea dietziae]